MSKFLSFPSSLEKKCLTLQSKCYLLLMMNQEEKELLLQKYADVNHRLNVANAQLEQANRKLKEYEEKMAKAEKASQMKTLFLLWEPAESSIMMTTDENRLTQVFSNLISNALKHTPKGFIRYGYRLTSDNHEIEFFVSDTGAGIDPSFIPHIFDTYASKDADQQRGYGLGLALCRIIVERMGGHIDVESELGKGSTFTFVLPFQGTVGGMAVSNRTNAQSMRTLRVSSNRDEMNMKTVLVAEDEESNYELVRIVLQKRYHLLRAHNGIEAVMMNEDEKPDLILMDIHMPEMSGLDATRIIKEVNHEVPVIALSAYAFDENIREAKAAGCDDFMPKPFKVEDLIEIIQRYIGH